MTDINDLAKLWASENYDKSIVEAFIAGHNANKDFIDNILKTKEEKIKAKKKVLYDTLVPFVGEYTKEMIREFYDYWSEADSTLNKLRYQKEKTWEVEKRLKRWSDNNSSQKGVTKGAVEDKTPSRKYTEIT